ncbi:hypothetical protein QM012_005521 [Aureobasidium pullulans]|uniref:Uncharacterized protein n=1 Tax=Aureobasidium pullulans TaxID=5580 RepID=A0ABR0T5X8_AURPU
MGHPGCHHEWCFLCEADWGDCLGSCEGTYEDARWLNEEDGFELEDWEVEEIATEEAAAAAQLSAEFSDWELSSADAFLRSLHVVMIVYKEDIAENVPEVSEGLVWAGETLYATSNEPLGEELYHTISWRITEVRSRQTPSVTGPNDPLYARNHEVLEEFLMPLRYIRSAEFIDAEEEATRMLALNYESDQTEDLRSQESVLLSLVRSDPQ